VRAAGCAILLLLAAILAGCAPSIDAEQARICRQALPALNPDHVALRILRAAPLAAGNGVVITYEAAGPGQRRRDHRVTCQFATSTGAAGERLLTRLSQDGEPLGGASLYLLKRFWLDTPDAALADPGALARQPARGLNLPAGLAIGLQHAVSALPGMAIYALLASAYALVYGLIGRINLAFGEFAALGGVAASLGVAIAMLAGSHTPGIMLAAALDMALIVTVIHGLVMARLVLLPLMGRPGQHVLVATIGLAIVLQEYMRMAQWAGIRWVSPIFDTPLVIARSGQFLVTITPIALAVAAVAFIAAGTLLIAMRRSRFGRNWRAIADDPKAAALFGVSARAVYGQTLALSCGLAGLAGMIITVYYGGIGFAGGTVLGLKALVGAVAGGIGSVPGAMLGGLLIGVIETAWSATLPITNRDIVIYGLLVVLLALKPGGLFGFAGLTPRRV
jgi:branched-subunit amino acid ABC-type transport system permease component